MKPNTLSQAAAQAQETPVANPTRVSPEELGAIRPPVSQAEQKGQDYSSEDKPSEPLAEPKVEEPLSSQYAILARKEKALRQREQLIKAKEAEYKAKEQPVQAPKPSFDESKFISKDRLTQDPFAVLNELGLDYNKLTDLVMNAPSHEQMALMNEIKSLKSEIQSIKGETENNKKTFEESQKQQYSQALNQIRLETQNLVKLDPQFETIKATNSTNDVVSLIERTFNEDGYLMTVEEAALEVENYLVDEAIRLSKLKKIQQRLTPKAQPEALKSTVQSQQPQLKTLTNSVSSSKKLTSRERAILAAEGKLTK